MPLFEFDTWNLLSTLVISLGMQALFFLFAALLRSDVFTDITYAMTFALLSLLLLFGAGDLEPARLIIAGLIIAWSLRLGGYLLVRILRTGRDARFDGIREKPLRFAAFWFFQGISIWIIMLPLTLAMSRPGDWSAGWALVVGAAVWALGLLIETVADQQKFRFRNRPENSGRFINRGLWRTSRHPNYFGEMMCWWGLFVVTIPALEGWQLLAVAGPLFLTLLLRFGTGVPTVARQQREKYGHQPEFQKYLRTTRLLVPWFTPRR